MSSRCRASFYVILYTLSPGNILTVPFLSFWIMSASNSTETIAVHLSEDKVSHDATHISDIAKFPVEILLYVISFLDIPDILALRKVFLSLLSS